MKSTVRMSAVLRYAWVVLVATALLAPALAADDATAPAVKAKPAEVEKPKAAEAEEAGGQPVMVVEPTHHDFGQITSATKVSFKYKILNKGDADLKIDRVKASCGCTGTMVSEKIIPPGKAGYMQAEFDPGRFHNKVTKSVTIYANDPKTPQQRVTFTATIIDPIQIEPRFIRFREVIVGGSARMDVLVKSATDKPFNITKVEARPANAFSATLDDSVDLPGGQQKIVVEVTAPTEKRNLSGELIVHTDNPELPTLDARMYAMVKGRVDFQPQRVFIPVQVGSTASRTVTVKPSVEVETFEVTAAHCDVANASAELIGKDADGYKVRVVATAPENAPVTYRSGKLTVQTNVPGEEQATVPVTVSIRPGIKKR